MFRQQWIIFTLKIVLKTHKTLNTITTTQLYTIFVCDFEHVYIQDDTLLSKHAVKINITGVLVVLSALYSFT